MTATQDAAEPLRDRTAVLVVVAAGVTVLLWASAFVAIRHVGHDFSPGALALGRLLVGSAVLGAIALARRPRWPAREDWPRLLVIGVVWFGGYNLALNAAEQSVDAGTTSMLVNIGPLLIAVFAGLLLGEGFPRLLLIGMLVAFSGVIIIGTATSTGSGGALGVVLCVAAAAAYAIGVVTQKPLLARLPALQVTWLTCTIGAIACLPFGPALVNETARAEPSKVAWVVFLGVFPTAIAFTTWAYALTHTTAGRMGATTYLVAPVTILLAWALLGETPAALALIGGVLCLVGVAISRRTTKAAR